MQNDIFELETISTEADKTEVVNMIKEAAAGLLRIDSEKDLIKDIAARAKEEYEIAPADFNKVVKMYHKQSRFEEQQKHEKVIGLYEQLFNDDQDEL